MNREGENARESGREHERTRERTRGFVREQHTHTKNTKIYIEGEGGERQTGRQRIGGKDMDEGTHMTNRGRERDMGRGKY